MTLEDIPMLARFGRLYWNQMGPDVYGSVENALRQMLEDGGEDIREILRKEIVFIGDGNHYAKWFSRARYEKATIRQLGGAFIMPEDVPNLLSVIDLWGKEASENPRY